MEGMAWKGGGWGLGVENRLNSTLTTPVSSVCGLFNQESSG